MSTLAKGVDSPKSAAAAKAIGGARMLAAAIDQTPTFQAERHSIATIRLAVEHRTAELSSGHHTQIAKLQQQASGPLDWSRNWL